MTAMVTKEQTCSFTGYRPEKLPWGEDEYDPRCAALKQKLYDVAEALYDAGIRHFICGMAKGCDTYFCETILKLREERPGLTLEAAVPCPQQAERWSERDRRRYFRLVSQCDFETEIEKEYTPDCMSKRNRYLAENASVLVAVFDGKWGGTMQTVNLARKNGLEIIEIYP